MEDVTPEQERAARLFLDELMRECYRAIYPRLLDQFLRRISDNDLESYRIYLLREKIEATERKMDKTFLEDLRNELQTVEDEKTRRKDIAQKRSKAPRYKGEDRIPQGLVEEVKRHYTGDVFVKVFEEITGFQIFPRGGQSGQWSYRCTIHGEDRHPSGRIQAEDGRYHCFTCGAGGDVIKLAMEFLRLPFLEAVRYLGKRIPGYEYEKKEDGTWQRMK